MKIINFMAILAAVLVVVPAASGAARLNRPDDEALRRQLVPHKAAYDIKMVSRHSGAQVLNISGKMTFSWHPSCDAWITDQHFNLLYEYADGPPIRVESDFSTFESFDGKLFNFSSRRRRDGELYEELRGSATASAKSRGQVVYSLPPDVSFDLAPGSMFPMSHTLALMRNAREGKKFFTATVFDGSDSEGPVEISTFAGNPVNSPVQIESETIDKALISSPARKVRMAFFPLETEEAAADYEMSFVFHDNGVISDMLVEYGDFSVTQKLTSIEKSSFAACPPPAKKRGLWSRE